MPELPEVETIARALRPELIHQRILSAAVYWARTLAAPSPTKFRKAVQGRVIQGVSRRAKFLVLDLEDYNLLVHLRMSGDLAVRDSTIRMKHDRLALHLSDGRTLAFNDPRKFGRVWLTARPQDVLGGLGPEPLEKGFTADWLYTNLQNRKRRLKPLLLDQRFIAGLGNIYVDESLHAAGLHPLSLSNTVSARQAAALQRSIRKVLREGIRRNGASIDWVYRGGGYQHHFRVYDRAGQACRVCGTTIERLTVGQRGTHICPACQKLR
jgi:formamidopyrimidine-DNA glycosylase